MEYFWLALTVAVLLAFVVLWQQTRQDGWLLSLLATSLTLSNVPLLPGAHAMSDSTRLGLAIVRGVIVVAAVAVLIVTRVRRRRLTGGPE